MFLAKNQLSKRRVLNFVNFSISQEYQFRSTFFVIDIFEIFHFLKWCPILTPSHHTNSQNSIISFGYVDSYATFFPILYPPAWKLDNPYYHTERLSDRELEISILQKRLEIRSSVSKKGPNKINCLPDHQDLDLTKCSSCTRKDGLIRWSTCPLIFGCWLLDHAIYLKLRIK